MNKYETVVVLEPSLGEGQVKDEAARLQKVLETNGATEIDLSVWGKKELTHAMKKQRFGTYVAFTYRAPGEGVVQPLTSLLGLTDTVLRFQTHRINERPRKVKVNPKRKTRPSDELGEGLEASEF